MQNVPKLLVISLIVYSVVILGMHKTHKKKSFSYAATSKKKKKVKRTRTDKTMAEFTKSRDALLAELHY
ncbi:MAG TPA: hypothetical protein VLG71_01775, partial [Candidatus Limnocylindria bacterium]|nr:hypothetical protein [Candidatus Limnocylindria bacterium]